MEVKIDGNRIITEFMGLKWKSFNGRYNIFLVPEKEQLKYKAINIGGDRLPYDTSWNCLMPVVEKIEGIYDDFHGYFGVYINGNTCTIQGTKLRTDPDNFHPAYLSDVNAVFPTKIESTWHAVVEFIKWHNSNLKK